MIWIKIYKLTHMEVVVPSFCNTCRLKAQEQSVENTAGTQVIMLRAGVPRSILLKANVKYSWMVIAETQIIHIPHLYFQISWKLLKQVQDPKMIRKHILKYILVMQAIMWTTVQIWFKYIMHIKWDDVFSHHFKKCTFPSTPRCVGSEPVISQFQAVSLC